MKIGVSIKPILHVAEDPQEILEAIFVKEAGFDYVEVHTNDLNEIESFFLKLIKKSGIKFSVHCPHFYSNEKVNFCSDKKTDIQNADHWLKESIKYAKKLKSKNVVIHPDQAACSKKNSLKILETHIKNNLKLLTKNQKILIENMPGENYPLSTPHEFKEFLKKFKKQVAVCWDIGHEIVRFQKQQFTFPKILKNKIKEVHISGIVEKQGRFGDHAPLTKNKLKLKQALDSLKEINFKGPIIFEISTNNPLDILESKKEIDKSMIKS
ncbi:MAG: sugar phosphate isomerase/epimerase [Nanoarchaeota archaeon]|nr:sugar phosphate isomerase/epimerase [Nanoarchaeota archaeon]MBU1103366.1 sugar phosphate isomerase/epimerase [Nanoarchaeota archaeon]